MRLLGLFTRGMGSTTTLGVAPAQWAWGAAGLQHQTYPTRVRGDGWVEFGHVQDDNPQLDTRDRP